MKKRLSAKQRNEVNIAYRKNTPNRRNNIFRNLIASLDILIHAIQMSAMRTSQRATGRNDYGNPWQPQGPCRQKIA
jgi:hypothetical protein